jgi:hypothetical protein
MMKRYLTTQRVNAMHQAVVCRDLVMHYSAPAETEIRPGFPLWDVPEGMEAFLVTKARIQEHHRCK